MLNKDLVDHDLSDEVCELLPASRHKTYVVKVGQVKIGGNNPIVVQSMALGVHIDSDNVKQC